MMTFISEESFEEYKWLEWNERMMEAIERTLEEQEGKQIKESK